MSFKFTKTSQLALSDCAICKCSCFYSFMWFGDWFFFLFSCFAMLSSGQSHSFQSAVLTAKSLCHQTVFNCWLWGKIKHCWKTMFFRHAFKKKKKKNGFASGREIEVVAAKPNNYISRLFALFFPFSPVMLLCNNAICFYSTRLKTSQHTDRDVSLAFLNIRGTGWRPTSRVLYCCLEGEPLKGQEEITKKEHEGC